MIDCVVAPVDHRLFVKAEEVRVTFPPAQKVVGPLAVTVGAAGIGFTVMTAGAVTVIDGVVSPVDQTLPLAADELSTTEPPSQKVVEPLAVMVGVAGVGFTVTAIAVDAPEEQPF